MVAITATPHYEVTPPVMQVHVTAGAGKTFQGPVHLSVQTPTEVWSTRNQPAFDAADQWVNEPFLPYGTTLVFHADWTLTDGTSGSVATGNGGLDPGAAVLVPLTSGLAALKAHDPAIGGNRIVSMGEATMASTLVEHDVLGAAAPTFYRTGPRRASSYQMAVRTVDAGQRNILDHILAVQCPTMLCIPASWGWQDGNVWLQITDATRARLLDYGPEPHRLFTLTAQQIARPW